MKELKFFIVPTLAKSPYHKNEPCYRTALSLIFFNYYLFDPNLSRIRLELHALFDSVKQHRNYVLSENDQKFLELNRAYLDAVVTRYQPTAQCI